MSGDWVSCHRTSPQTRRVLLCYIRDMSRLLSRGDVMQPLSPTLCPRVSGPHFARKQNSLLGINISPPLQSLLLPKSGTEAGFCRPCINFLLGSDAMPNDTGPHCTHVTSSTRHISPPVVPSFRTPTSTGRLHSLISCSMTSGGLRSHTRDHTSPIVQSLSSHSDSITTGINSSRWAITSRTSCCMQ